MKPAFYSGASGLAAFQQKMNVIGNNMANVNTNGYKPGNVAFQDLLYTNMYANAGSNPISGVGVKAISGGLQFTQGPLQNSVGDFDFALVGDGLFAVEQNGETLYTRDGAFTLSQSDGGTYLTTQDGAYVLDSSGAHIPVSTFAEDPENATTDRQELLELIGVFHVNNPSGLDPRSGNRYLPSANSGEATSMELGTYQMKHGYLESSKTSMMDTMVEMITAQRAFQMSAKVVQASDEVEQTISNLRK